MERRWWRPRVDAPLTTTTWVIGGAQIYALALPLATRCEVTEVDVDLRREDDDAVAPVLDESWVGHRGGLADQRVGAALPVLQLPADVSTDVELGTMTG